MSPRDGLVLGHVEIKETYSDDFTVNAHSNSSDDYTGIEHILLYFDMEYVNKMKFSELENF